tara:strand:+ start:134 stop:535 length:402 start_codon:yes stop_codon:yes gene_type:complete
MLNKATLTNLICLCILILSIQTYGQQEADYALYNYNPITINPAFAGMDDGTTFIGMYRAQWNKIEGAPETSFFTFENSLSKGHGIGLSLVNDKLGPSNEINLYAHFAYSLKLNKSLNLRFGVNAGGDQLSIDY